jgi:Ion channel
MRGPDAILAPVDIAHVLIGLAGVALAAIILWDAFETVLVPRRIGRRIRLTRYFYIVMWRLWRRMALGMGKPSRRESLLGFFGPLSLILLLAFWAAGLILAFALMEVAANASAGLEPRHWATLLYMSGETFFTLGFGDITPSTGLGRVLAVLEAGLGFGFLGTVVGYLPTMYSAFAQREIEISLLDARAGSPPSAAEFLSRTPAVAGTSPADEILHAWERWAAQLLETHISYPQLAYYRSQHSNQSWLGALTAILDSSAILVACSESRGAHQARLTFAMARHALVDVTQIFVPAYRDAGIDRLAPADLERLRVRLANSPMSLPDAPDFAVRLTELRRLYEPYAQALAAYLLLDLPPWVHAEVRRDNWRGGPWDRQLGTNTELSALSDEHF